METKHRTCRTFAKLPGCTYHPFVAKLAYLLCRYTKPKYYKNTYWGFYGPYQTSSYCTFLFDFLYALTGGDTDTWWA